MSDAHAQIARAAPPPVHVGPAGVTISPEIADQIETILLARGYPELAEALRTAPSPAPAAEAVPVAWRYRCIAPLGRWCLTDEAPTNTAITDRPDVFEVQGLDVAATGPAGEADYTGPFGLKWLAEGLAKRDVEVTPGYSPAVAALLAIDHLRGAIEGNPLASIAALAPRGEVINGERCTIHGPIARYSETCMACEEATGRPRPQAQEGTVVVHTSRGPVDVDSSLAPFVSLLNMMGLETKASCSGHGHRPGNIALRDGREIIIARNWCEGRRIDTLFPIASSGERMGEDGLPCPVPELPEGYRCDGCDCERADGAVSTVPSRRPGS